MSKLQLLAHYSYSRVAPSTRPFQRVWQWITGTAGSSNADRVINFSLAYPASRLGLALVGELTSVINRRLHQQADFS
jgi:hypothetical protein